MAEQVVKSFERTPTKATDISGTSLDWEVERLSKISQLEQNLGISSYKAQLRVAVENYVTGAARAVSSFDFAKDGDFVQYLGNINKIVLAARTVGADAASLQKTVQKKVADYTAMQIAPFIEAMEIVGSVPDSTKKAAMLQKSYNAALLVYATIEKQVGMQVDKTALQTAYSAAQGGKHA